MPVTIEELDATVRAFYEGRGEQVHRRRLAVSGLVLALGRLLLTIHLSPRTAKGCSSCS